MGLKPCPTCNVQPGWAKVYYSFRTYLTYVCPNCYLAAHTNCIKDLAADNWNHRNFMKQSRVAFIEWLEAPKIEIPKGLARLVAEMEALSCRS
jgi:hypothetical protein